VLWLTYSTFWQILNALSRGEGNECHENGDDGGFHCLEDDVSHSIKG
jgi:hypothetical protein